MPLSRIRDAERKRQQTGNRQRGNIQPLDSNPNTIATLPEIKRTLTDIIRAPLHQPVMSRDKISAADQLNKLHGWYPIEKVPSNIVFNITYVERSSIMGAPWVHGAVIEGEAKELAEGDSKAPDVHATSDSCPNTDTIDG